MSIKVEDSRTDNNLITINIDQEKNSRKKIKKKKKKKKKIKTLSLLKPFNKFKTT
jgi:hypothetical protein